MSTTKQKPAARASRKPKAPTKHGWQAKEIGQQVKAGIKDDLRRQFEEFLEYGRAEELRFLVQIFRDWG